MDHFSGGTPVTQIPTTIASVYAFRIASGVSYEEVGAVAGIINDAMDQQDKISILFKLVEFGPTDAMTGMSFKSLNTQMRSIAHVNRYAVVGTPARAEEMIESVDKSSSVKAYAFEPEQEDVAWASVGAHPLKMDLHQPT